jgi:hypothetical protein
MRLSEDGSMGIEQLTARLENCEEVLFCGDGLYKYAETLKNCLRRAASLLRSQPCRALLRPARSALEKLKEGRDVSDYHSFCPNISARRKSTGAKRSESSCAKIFGGSA